MSSAYKKDMNDAGMNEGGAKLRFEVLAWGLARVSELYHFLHEGAHGGEWSIKGHNRPWIIQRGGWKSGMRFLDVGAGYSDLPAHLVESYDLEGWVVDDYGASSGEVMWSRWGDPKELPQKYPNLKYIFKNLGTDVPELPKDYFDRVYSVSVLEHIPKTQIVAVLNHMARLLKPGGVMLHTIDIPFPRTVETSGFLPSLSCVFRVLIRKILIMARAHGHNPYLYSIEGWAALLRRILRLEGKLSNISTLQMLLDHDVLVEPPAVVYNVYPPNNEPKIYWRVASLTLIFRKLGA